MKIISSLLSQWDVIVSISHCDRKTNVCLCIKWTKATENDTMTKRPREANGRDENEKKTE